MKLNELSDSIKKNGLIQPIAVRKTKDKKKILLKNLNHYRDFISTKDISKSIKILFKNKKS